MPPTFLPLDILVRGSDVQCYQEGKSKKMKEKLTQNLRIAELLNELNWETWNPPTSGLRVMRNSKYLLFKSFFTSVLLLVAKLSDLHHIYLLYAQHSPF